MSLAFKFQAVALLIFTCTSLASPAPQATAPDHSLETVSLCELTEHWEKYDHKILRIEVIYHTSNEVSQVYNPGCATSDQTAWVKLLPYGSPSPVPTELKAKLSELLKKNGRVRITVVGEFDGPKKVEIPPDLSPKAAAVFRAGGSRYGHMNGWRFQFVFSMVEKVEPVPASDPWPTWALERRSDISGDQGGTDFTYSTNGKSVTYQITVNIPGSHNRHIASLLLAPRAGD